MSINYSNFGNLLSNSGTNALKNYLNTSTTNSYTKQTQTYTSILSGITGGFDSGSIFSNSSGIQQNSSYSNTYNGNSWQTGNDGLNRRGAVNTNTSTVPQTDNPYAGGVYGSSIVGNYYTSIQSVALGQYAPTSVFEQRLNYHLDYSEQNKPGSMLGDYSNYFNVDSVAYNTSLSSGYNIFGTSSTKSANISKAVSAQTVSSLMSLLA